MFNSIRTYCRNKRYCEEDFPFDEMTICFKVGGKIFAISNVSPSSHTINLKCDPDRAIDLRATYSCIQAGYHMNKKHWNTIDFSTGELSNSQLTELIDHSYELVYQSLSKAAKAILMNGKA